MKVNLTAQQLGAWFLRLLAIAGVAFAAVDPNSLPASVRSTFAIASAIVLAVDRYVSDPSTGTSNSPTATPPAG